MNFYVYHLIDPSSMLPFYVGKGKGSRAQSHLDYYDTHNNYKNNKIKSLRAKGLEPLVEYVIENVTEQEAWDREILDIAKYGRKDIDVGGILTNRTMGSKGGDTSMCFTADTYKKLSANSTGINNPRSKFTQDQVIEIYYSTDKTADIATKFQVSTGTIKDIKRKTYYRSITENFGPPGYHSSLKRIPLSDDIIKEIYYFSGTAKDFKEKFNCSVSVARNIKFGKTYSRVTLPLIGEAGEIKIHNLTWDEICEIRSSDDSCAKLGKQYKVHPETIRNIRNGKTRNYT